MLGFTAAQSYAVSVAGRSSWSLPIHSHLRNPEFCGWNRQLQQAPLTTNNFRPFALRVVLSQVRAMATKADALSTSHNQALSHGGKLALISLSDKTDLAFLGKGLQELGYTLVSTGGTASALEDIGLVVTRVEQLTSFPEMLDGRVKTLHPHIHGGILARRDLKHHMDALDQHGIRKFDVVVVNLYPFYGKVTSSANVEFEDGIENIDIGGPAMIRAAAKALLDPPTANMSRESDLSSSLLHNQLSVLLEFS